MTPARDFKYLESPDAVVRGLLELASAALLGAFPRLSADENDIGLVLDTLRLLRPLKAEIGALDGVFYMTRSNWDDAIYVLRNVCETAPRFGHARALLAYCLSMKEDPEWRRYADEALEISPGRDTQYLVSALKARADLLHAVKVADLNGQFVMPESVTALSEFTDKSIRHINEKLSLNNSEIMRSVPDAAMFAFPRV